MPKKKNRKDVLIAGCAPMITYGLKAILQNLLPEADIEDVPAIGMATDMIQKKNYILVLVDMGDCGQEKIGLLNKIMAIAEPAKVILLCDKIIVRQYRILYKLKVAAIVGKWDPLQELEHAMQQILNTGGLYISTGVMLSLLRRNDATVVEQKLTNREMVIAEMLVQGKKNMQICKELSLRPSTVSTFKARIMQKMEIRNSIELSKKMQNNQKQQK